MAFFQSTTMKTLNNYMSPHNSHTCMNIKKRVLASKWIQMSLPDCYRLLMPSCFWLKHFLLVALLRPYDLLVYIKSPLIEANKPVSLCFWGSSLQRHWLGKMRKMSCFASALFDCSYAGAVTHMLEWFKFLAAVSSARETWT